MWCKGRLAWIGIGATAAMLALTGVASAVPLSLTGPIQGNTVGPQSTSNPCIIAGTACSQPAGFGFGNFVQSGAISSYNQFSTSDPSGGNNGVTLASNTPGIPYTVGQLENAVGTDQLLVAIDVNTAGGTGGGLENLSLFEVIINGVVAFNFVGPALIGNIANNGNGFGDWTLGVIDLSGFANNATVLFHAVWTNASDGAESFFLVPGPLAGAGLPGLVLACGGLIALARRRRQQIA
jgi:hypothetical protein